MIQPSKTPFKNHFFGKRYPYSQSWASTIYDCMRPALRKRYLMQIKRLLKVVLKAILKYDSFNKDNQKNCWFQTRLLPSNFIVLINTDSENYGLLN